MITLTVSAGQIFYFGGCAGVMISGLFLLILHEILRLIARPSGAHSAARRATGCRGCPNLAQSGLHIPQGARSP